MELPGVLFSGAAPERAVGPDGRTGIRRLWLTGCAGGGRQDGAQRGRRRDRKANRRPDDLGGGRLTVLFSRIWPPVRHAPRREWIRCGRGGNFSRDEAPSVLSLAVQNGAERHPVWHCGGARNQPSQARNHPHLHFLSGFSRWACLVFTFWVAILPAGASAAERIRML
jgi:hypothetical protein